MNIHLNSLLSNSFFKEDFFFITGPQQKKIVAVVAAIFLAIGLCYAIRRSFSSKAFSPEEKIIAEEDDSLPKKPKGLIGHYCYREKRTIWLPFRLAEGDCIKNRVIPLMGE